MSKILFPMRQGMVSGYDKAISRKYNIYTGKSGDRWLVADQENPGDNIYVEGGPNSQGFGGARLTFMLKDDTKLELIGPWHSNSTALFMDTGIDVRDKHLTYGIIADTREPGPKGGFEWYYSGIIHLDEAPTVGYYDRIERIANAWSREHQKSCYYCFLSRGGGSASSTHKKDWEHE